MDYSHKYLLRHAKVDACAQEADDWNPKFNEAYEYRDHIYAIIDIATQVIRTKESLFTGKPFKAAPGAPPIIRVSPLGKALLWAMGLDVGGIRRHFVHHEFCPTISTFLNLAWSFKQIIPYPQNSLNQQTLPLYLQFVSNLKRAAKEKGLLEAESNQRRKMRKNVRRFHEVVDILFHNHARLCVVRLDVGFNRAHRESLEKQGKEIDSSHFTKCLNNLIRYVKNDFPSFLGYGLNIEYGPWKKLHSHVLLFFNGRDVKDDVEIAKVIGDHWKQKITAGTGGYYNCNRNKRRFEIHGLSGLGTIRYDEPGKRVNLMRTATYLMKEDHFIKLAVPGITKAFRSSDMPIKRETPLGRPRKPKLSLADICEPFRISVLPQVKTR